MARGLIGCVAVAVALSAAPACADRTPPRTAPGAVMRAAPCTKLPGGDLEPAAAPPMITIRIDGVVTPPSGAAEPLGVARIEVTLRSASPSALRTLETDAPRGPVRSAIARDARGPLGASLADGPRGARVVLDRDPVPPLVVVLDVEAIPPRTATLPTIAVDETHARVPFEWIPLPRALDASPVDVALELGRVGGQEVPAASTLGLGTSWRGTRELGALRRGYAILGELGTARLDAYEGDDAAAWLGFTSFDPRWVAAESAAVRSSLDRWVGARRGPLHTIVLVSEKRPDVPFAMAPRDGGLWISADLSTPWTAAARLGVAEHFARRFFGGALAVGERDDPSGVFWSEGVARVAGREVLFDLGAIGFDDLASELDAAIAAVVLSPLGERPLDAIAAVAGGSDERAAEARRVLAARGVLWASGLDARRRAARSGPRSLQEVVRALFARAATARQSTWSLAQLADEVATVCGDEGERQRLAGTGSPTDDRVLPDRAAGSCHRKQRGRIARYAFGASWDVAPPSTDPGAPIGTIREVKPGSPAARAGLAVGDALLRAAYVQGRPDVEAKLVVRRGGEEVSIAFFPRTGGVDGPVFVRRPGARDEACVR